MASLRKYANFAAQWVPIALAGLLPFFVLPPWVSVAQGKMLLVAGAVLIFLAAWVLARILEANVTIPRSALLLALAFLPIGYTASALWHRAPAVFVSPSGAQDTVVAMGLFFAVAAMIALAAPSAFRALTYAFRALFAGGAILVVFQIVRLAAPSHFSLGVLAGSASTLVGSWHDFGILLGLLAFLSAALIETPVSSGAWKWLVGGVGAASFLMLFIVNWPDVWYVLAALVALASAYRYLRARARAQTMREILSRHLLWIVLLLASVAGVFGSPYLYARLPAPVKVVQVEVRPSWQGTFTVGERVFSEGPAFIFGSGPNTFSRDWAAFRPTSVNATTFWNVDFSAGIGLVPTALVTVGLLGIFAWLLVFAAVAWSAWMLMRAREERSVIRELHAAIFGGALYLLIFQIVYTPGFAVSALAFLFLGLLVLAEAIGGGRTLVFPMSADNRKGVAALIAVIVASASLVVASASTVRATVSDVFVDRGASAYDSTRDIGSALAYVRSALSVYPKNDRAERAAVELGLLQLQALAAGSDSDEARRTLQETLSRTVAHGLSAVSIDERNYQNWLALASLYQSLAGAGVSGAAEAAGSAYARAREANPSNPQPLVSLAQLAAVEGRNEEALRYIDDALALKRDLPSAYYLRSQIKAGGGDFASARADARTAAELVPEDPLGWYNLGAILYAGRSYEAALPPLGQALELERDYSNALFVTALSLDALGRREEARAALLRLIGLNPGDGNLRTLLEDLDAGRPLRPEEAR